MNIYSFPIFLFSLRDYSCVDHMINITSSPLYSSYLSDYSALPMPITFRSYLAIISDHLSYCPMLLSFILSTQPLIYSIIFVPLTFRLIVPLSSYWTFYSTYLLALFLIVIPTKFRVFLTFLLVDSSTEHSWTFVEVQPHSFVYMRTQNTTEDSAL